MKSQREDCLPQTLRVAVMNVKIHMNVKNTGEGDLHLLRGQNIGIVDLRSAGYYHITRDGIQRCLHEIFIFLNKKGFPRLSLTKPIHLGKLLFLVTHRREHTCESAIYWNESPSLINEKCNFEYYHELTPEPRVLDAGDYLLWAGLPNSLDISLYKGKTNSKSHRR